MEKRKLCELAADEILAFRKGSPFETVIPYLVHNCIVVKNKEISKILYEMAELLELKGENRFKIVAYSKAARSLEVLKDDVELLHKQGTLSSIPGVGKGISENISEYLKTGKITAHQELLDETPPGLTELLRVPGLGPKTVALLSEKLGVVTIDDLEKAAKEHRIRRLPRMGPTKEANILRGIDRYRKRSNRIPLGIAEPIVEETVAFLRLLPGISNLTVAGSYRRGRETVGDVDILATSKDPAPIINAFSKMPIVEEVLAEGPTKSSVIVKDTVQVDLRIVDPRSYGTVVQYFTGSKEHNVRLRGIALQKGYSLSEYSMKRLVDSKELYFDKEEDVYGFLGLPFIPPELREDEGEIEAAISGRLPKLVELSEIKGDLHVHTSWSDGSGSLQEMAQAVKMNGMQYFAACDHSPSIGIAGGLSEEKLLQKIDEIDRLNSSNEDFLILSGTEVDIRADGSLDYPNRILAKCDVVVASIHMAQGQSEREINGRLISAIENEFVDIIAHPTGRIIGARDPYQVDMQAVLDAAARTETIMEINAHPARLDLDDRWSRKAMEMGIRLVVNTDAHAPDHLSVMKYGVKVARRAWLEKKDVVNTMNLEQIRDFFLG